MLLLFFFIGVMSFNVNSVIKIVANLSIESSHASYMEDLISTKRMCFELHALSFSVVFFSHAHLLLFCLTSTCQPVEKSESVDCLTLVN